MVEMIINSGVNASSGFSPFELSYGFIPKLSHFGASVPSSDGV